MEDDMNEGTRTRIGTSTYWFGTAAGDLGDGSGVGAYVSYLTNQYGIHFGVVGNSLDDSEVRVNEANNEHYLSYSGKSQMTISSRVYYAPYVADNSALMIGATGFYRRFGESYSGTGTIDNNKYYANDFTKFSGELMFVMNNFALLGEYMAGKVKVSNEAREWKEKGFNLYDYYVQASYVLTGENYGYDSGYFNSYTVANPVNEGGFGSFELFAGYYVDDFSKEERALGNKTDTITAGLNWSPLNQFRLFFTYNNVKVKEGKNDGSDNKYNEYKLSARMFF